MAKHYSEDAAGVDVTGEESDVTDVEVTDALTDTDDTADTDADTPTTARELGTSDAGAPKHGFFVRLYTGTGAFDVVGKRKLWFGVSGVIILIALASILIRGFTFGIDFEGGTKVAMPAAGAQGQVTTQQVEDVFSKTLGRGPESVVQVGNGGSATIQIRTEKLSNPDNEKLRTALFDAFQPKAANGQPSKDEVSSSDVSETWGGQITQKAIIALFVFLALVAVYIAVRYERYMAAAALAALVFDIVTTAGVYSLVGFEVTPATVIGLLTILGFSLYDTVIVFDKVEENVRGFEHTTRRTFAEHANLAINQTFMRSINTSLISRAADPGPHRDRRVAAGGRHPAGSGAGAARRRHRRHVLVDLLRHPVAGRDAGTDRPGAFAHPSRREPAQGFCEPGRRHRRDCRRRRVAQGDCVGGVLAAAHDPGAGEARTGREADPSHGQALG